MNQTFQTPTRFDLRRSAACAAATLTMAFALALSGCAETKDTSPQGASAPGGTEVAAASSAKAASSTVTAPVAVAAMGGDHLNGNEWVTWRGPENSGVSRATGLVTSWKTIDENLLWKADVEGRSTPVIFDGRAYVLHLTGSGPTWQEEVVCLDAMSGSIIWRKSYPIFHTTVPAQRVGWASPCVDPETGYVYVHTVSSDLICLDRDGNEIWILPLGEMYGEITGYGGRTHTPLVDNEKLIISFLNSSLGPHGKGSHRYLALDKRSGEVIWWSSPGGDPLDTTYSVPAVAVINGIRMLIGGNGDGAVHALKIETGEPVWNFKLSKRGINVSVIVDGNRVYAAHSEDNLDNTAMGRVVCIDATGAGDVTKTHEVWRYDGFIAGYSSPALQDGVLYVISNNSTLAALDAEKGTELWTLNVGNAAKGSPTWADGHLYYAEQNGYFYIVKVSREGGEIVSELHFESDDGTILENFGSPAIAYGNIYMLNFAGMFCVGKKDYKQQPISIAPIAETGPGEPPAAHLQVIPGEVQLHAGDPVKFRTRLFDAKGRPLGPPEEAPAWSHSLAHGGIEAGTDDSASLVTTPGESEGQFGTVTAKLGNLTASSRVRIYQNLPIIEDFESGGKTASWLGASKVKFETIEMDNGRVWKKDATNTKFTRAYVFLTDAAQSDYTITADGMSREEKRRMGDIGIINNRYQFDLLGNDQQIRLIAWVPMPRLVSVHDYEWDPDVWYTLKMRVDYEGDGARVRGKVWPRDEAEPEAWTIEMEDPVPYRHGSPGLHVYALAECYYDNIRVEPN